MSIIVAILVFSVLIFIHELGHFFLAKINGIRVVEFSIGMGPRIFSFEKGDTRYSLKLLFFGGSCQMLDEDYFPEEGVEIDKEKAFTSKSVWARITVIIAGPLFNFILAFILAVIVMGKAGYDAPFITNVEANSVADKAGLQSGDLITSFNGESITLSRELMVSLYVDPIGEDNVDITYERDGKEYEVTLVPEKKESYVIGISYSASDNSMKISEIVEGGAFDKAGVKQGDIIVEIDGAKISSGKDFSQYMSANPLDENVVKYKLTRDGEEYEIEVTPEYKGSYYTIGFGYNTARYETTPFESVKYSFSEIKYQIKSVFKSLGMLFKGKLGVNDFTGPVGIVDIIDDTYQESKSEGFWAVFLNIANITILLSANLGVMNLLPIPGLDGGRLIFLIIEAIFRKPVPRKFEGIVTAACMMLLMLFAVYILFHDISKIF